MRFILVVFIGVLATLPVYAQQVDPPQPPFQQTVPFDPETYIQKLLSQRDKTRQLSDNLEAQLPSVAAAYEGRLAETLKWLIETNDYWRRWCGDRPGCKVE